MEATDFTRDDCQLGHKRITYTRLERDYRCNDCSGRITTRWSEEIGWHASCLACGGCDFIHEREAQRQQWEALEVLEGLPAELAAALGYEQRKPNLNPVLFPLGLPEPIEI
jgi:uncharacterized protein YlaI